MKKIVSILIALVLTLSLAACGSSDGDEGTANKPSLIKSNLTTYVNENALNNTDNITFSIGKTENENEEFIINIQATDLLKDLSAIEEDNGNPSRLANDIINLRLFRNSNSQSSNAYFTFKDYGEFNITSDNAATDTIQGDVISEEGCFVLTKDADAYKIWAKDKEQTILIKVDGLLDKSINRFRRIKGEEAYKTLFNIITEHFTFARIGTKEIEKNGIIFTTYDLNNVTVLGDNASTNVKDWVFACDVLYKELEKIGVSLVTAHCLTSEGSKISAPCILAENVAATELPKAFQIGFSSIDEVTFDSAPADNEFTIGGIKFREDVDGPNRSNGMGFIIKMPTGTEYVCDIYPRGSILTDKLDINTAKEYLEKIILAN